MMKSNTLVRVGFVQTPIAARTPEKNLEALLDSVRALLRRRPDLVLLPEFFLGGPRQRKDRRMFALVYREALQELCALARENAVYFFGSFLEQRQSRYFNTAGLVTPGGRLASTYQKNHLFQFYHEHRLYTAGRQSGVFITPWGKVAPQICYDIRFPELLRKLVFLGARLALVCAQWPSVRAEHWLTLLKARAIENQIYVLACNRSGQNFRGDDFGGQSCVISPWGEVEMLARANQVMLLHVVDLQRVDTVRAHYPFFKDALQRRIRFDV
jgi:predicted amidohydrolase